MLSNLRDLTRHAARRLRRAPAFTLAAAITLALGIGGTVAVFTVVDGVLFRPLAYANPENLVDLSHTLAISGLTRVDESDATYLLYRRDNHSFTDVGAYSAAAVNVSATSAAGTTSGQSERLPASLATSSTFRVLGTSPAQGRGLTDDDDRPGAAPVALISHGLWQRDYAGDSGIIGHHISVDGVDREIVGVMPADFHFPTSETALWLPLTLDAARTRSAAFDYRGIARLRPGVTIAAATADLQRLLPQVPVVFPGRLSAAGITATHMQSVVRPLRDVIIGDVGRVLWIILGAVSALLLVACANVASLFLARAEGRRRELAVRRALGAGRVAALGELMSEAFILSALGGLLGLALGIVGVRVLQSLSAGATIPRLAEVRVDGVVVALTAAITAATALLVSALPVLRSGTASLASVLAANSPSSSGGRMRNRARRVLVVAQVALALMLLATAGLFARSFARLRGVNPGFDAASAVSFRIALPQTTFPGAGDVAQLALRTIDALGSVPGVQAVGVTTKLPLDDEARQDSAVFVEDHPLAMGDMPGIHGMAFVTPNYFRAMGIPLLAGRSFMPLEPSADSMHLPREVIVSEALAKKYWKTTSPVGRRLMMNPAGGWLTVVGVVGSVRDAALDQPAAEMVYSPLVTMLAGGKPFAPRNLAFVVRTAGDPDALTASIRAAVQSAAPTLPVYRLVSLRTLEAAAAARTTFTLLLLGVAGVVATIVGATGIYGVIAYLVSLRRREIGVRLALGATPAGVRGLMVRHALTDAGMGVAIGLTGVLASAHLLSAALFGVGASDPLALGAAAGILMLTAAAASWIPARRAAAVDPASALRAE
jgi:putative ABC transport system permease protein